MKKITTTIEINDVDIKLFQAEKRPNGKAAVILYDIRLIEDCSPEKNVELLRVMIGALPVFPKNPVLLLPSRFAIFRQMRLPSHEPGEIEDMISLQLINNIPYSLEDVIFRYHILSQDDEGYSLVLVAIVCREFVFRYHQMMQEAGIKDCQLTLNSFGILNWHVLQESKKAGSNDGTIAYLNIDSQYSDICFCHGKELYFSRNISMRRKCLESNGHDELVDQAELSLDIYREDQLGPEVQKILIYSGCDKTMALKEQLEKKLHLPIEIAKPSEKNFSLSSQGGSVCHDQYPFSTAAGLGFLLSNTRDIINFAQKPNAIKTRQNIQMRRIVKVASVALAVMILFASSKLAGLTKKKTQLKMLITQAYHRQTHLDEARQKIQLVESFDRKLSRYYFIPELINEFSHLTPDGISFRRLSLNKEGASLLHGQARTHAGINDFQSRLIQSEKFHNIDLQFATNRKIANQSVLDFKISMQIYENKKSVP